MCWSTSGTDLSPALWPDPVADQPTRLPWPPACGCFSEPGCPPLRRALALVADRAVRPDDLRAGRGSTASMHTPPGVSRSRSRVGAAHVRGVRRGGGRWHVLRGRACSWLGQGCPGAAGPRAGHWSCSSTSCWCGVTLPWGDTSAPAVGAAGARSPPSPWPPSWLAVALQLFVVVPGPIPTPTWSTVGRTMMSALSQLRRSPSFVNQPSRLRLSVPAANWVVLAVVVLVGVVLARVRPPGNAGPLLSPRSTFALYYGFLKFSPLLQRRHDHRRTPRGCTTPCT